jgi:hypothetical protein
MSSTSPTFRVTTASRSDMVATSSTCSLMNHCMNCSEAKSFSSRAIRSRALICSVTRRSWSRASATGATTSAKVGTGAATPGMTTSESVSSR